VSTSFPNVFEGSSYKLGSLTQPGFDIKVVVTIPLPDLEELLKDLANFIWNALSPFPKLPEPPPFLEKLATTFEKILELISLIPTIMPYVSVSVKLAVGPVVVVDEKFAAGYPQPEQANSAAFLAALDELLKTRRQNG